MTEQIKITYDGSASSVDKIMDIVGTGGVNNTNNQVCLLPFGELLRLQDSVVSKDGYWWIESKKYEVRS